MNEDFNILGIYVKYIGPEDPDEECQTYCGFEIDGSYVELFNSLWKFTYKDYDVFIREGVWCEMDEETGDYLPDWSLSWFYMYEDDPENYLYFEQDGPEVSTYNLLRQLNNFLEN